MKHAGCWLGLPETFWIAMLIASIVAIGAVLFVWLLDKNEPLRRAHVRAKRAAPPVIGRDITVPRASALPTLYRHGRRDAWPRFPLDD